VSSRGLRAAGSAPVLGLWFALLGCERGASPAPAGSAGMPQLRYAQASEFVCEGPRCTQRHVRLPDDGEWRCAEREGVVWCAGGERAAGVVSVASDRGYLCGERRIPRDAPADRRRERICVDPSPDVPRGARGAYSCRFAQERGITRECVEKATSVRSISVQGPPNCWLDADCAPAMCDRGHCASGAP